MTQGAIADRTREQLGASDREVVFLRRLLFEQLERVEQGLDPMGTVLGILPDLGYTELSVQLDPGDLIAIYSDGVTEANNARGEEFGEERLVDRLTRLRDQPASRIVSTVMDDVADWSTGATSADDVTVVVARRIAG